MKKIVYLFWIFSLGLSCTHRRTAADFIDMGKSNIEYSSIEEYLKDREENIIDSVWVDFRFLNNPYNLTENNLTAIYANDCLVYRGCYRGYLKLKGLSDEIFAKDDNQLQITIEVLTDKNKKKLWLHRFHTKVVFAWKEDYKIIYLSLFPTNESVEQMFFIPHTDINF